MRYQSPEDIQKQKLKAAWEKLALAAEQIGKWPLFVQSCRERMDGDRRKAFQYFEDFTKEISS
jgi:hypothetical protein